MRAFSPAIPPAKRPTSAAAWTPAALATLRQWLSDNYYSSPVGGLQVIESLEPHGTVRAPQPGCCALFDGVNDYGTLGGNNRLTSGGQTAFTITATLIPNSITGNLAICSEWDAGTIFALHQSDAKLKLLLYYSESPTLTSASTTDSDVLAVGVPVKIAVTYNAGVVVFYVNGVVVANTQVGGAASALRSAASTFRVGALATGTWCYDGKLADIRVYSVAKTAPEVAAIAACDFTNMDKTSIIEGWYFNDREGTVARGWSGNGHDLTLSGPITEATFWAEDSAITANPANVLGYTLSGSTIIPRDESDITKDVQGNALGNTGLSPYPVTIDTPCITFNGVTTDYATLTSINAGTVHTFSAWAKITADAIFLSSAGPNDYSLFFYSGEVWYRANSVTVNFAYSPPSGWAHYAVVRNGTAVKFYVNGAQVGTTQTLAANSNLTLTHLAYPYNSLSVASMALHSDAKSDAEILAMCNGTENRTNLLRSWKCQEGPGTANTNVTLYDDSGNGNHLTVVGGTVADQWDNLCPGYVRDRAFEYGGRVVYGNQLAYSNFASGWTTTTTTLTVSGSTDPNGGATASKITPNSTGNTRSIYNTTTVSAKHISVCCKADGVNWINLINVGGTLPAAWFNVSTGTVGTVVAGYTATIEDLGTGWFRCRLFKDDGSPFIYVQVSITNSDNTTTVTASGSNGVLVWEPVATNIKGPLVPTSGTAITGDVFIPLVPGTLLCADGNAATLSAGKRGNPYSQMIPSPFDAAELNKFGFTSATRITATETFDDASSIADTGFGRIGADGIDREFLADEALTGADLTNAQAYVA